ncbi:hypothetical protein BDZ89DRAFT_1108017 [Hymenopellis radicata]|nr:hypothetical protein BDZ89DRAFT_1108017 [Hymenopellis radicata]
MSTTSSAMSFLSDSGRKVIRDVGKSHLPFDPHDFSIKAAACLLDKSDVMIRTACGSGKTGTIALIAIVLAELHRNPSLVSPGYVPWWHSNPVMLVICPTNALEDNIAYKLNSYGITSVILNSERIAAAQNAHDNGASVGLLWEAARMSRVVLLSPEMLKSDAFRQQMGLGKPDSPFKERCCLLVCDEAHLIYMWGKEFREAYGDIGVFRNVLNPPTRLLLMTATLREGKPLNFVRNSFALHSGNYTDIHLSNLRPHVRNTTSILTHSLNGFDFSELRWVLGLPGITIIFVANRFLALRLTLYLRRINPYLAKYVRKFDALNEKQTYDAHTIGMARDITSCTAAYHRGLILVSTSILMVGVDLDGVSRVLTIEPTNPDEEIQYEGRVYRNPARFIGVPETYTYVTKKAMDDARKLVDGVRSGTITVVAHRKKGEDKKSEVTAEELSWAERLVAPCRLQEQDRQYQNPPYAAPPPCQCVLCGGKLPTRPSTCLCSGCQPGTSVRDRRLIIAQDIAIEATGHDYAYAGDQSIQSWPTWMKSSITKVSATKRGS